MRAHTANELRTTASVLDSDSTTVLIPAVSCGVEDLSGRRLEQAQLIGSQTTHMILFRYSDAAALSSTSYVNCEGQLYIVDYVLDPRIPRPRTWREVFCHIERGA